MAKKTVEGGSKSTTQISEGVVLLGVGLLAFTFIYTLRGTIQTGKYIIDPILGFGDWALKGSEYWTHKAEEGYQAGAGAAGSSWRKVTGAPRWFVESSWDVGIGIGEATSFIPEAAGQVYYGAGGAVASAREQHATNVQVIREMNAGNRAAAFIRNPKKWW